MKTASPISAVQGLCQRHPKGQMAKLSPVHVMVTQSGAPSGAPAGQGSAGSSCPITFCLLENPAHSPALHQEQTISMQGQLGD